MTLLSFYFVGSTLSIFSLFFVGMYGFNSLNAIFNVGNGNFLNIVFKPFDNPVYTTIHYKLLYCAINFVVFGAVIWRVNSMGLLPINPADWISMLQNFPQDNFSVNSFNPDEVY